MGSSLSSLSTIVQNKNTYSKNSEKDKKKVCKNNILKNITEEIKCKAKEYNRQMDNNKLPYLDTIGLMVNFKKVNTWSIYFHFTDWEGPVTALAIQNLRLAFCKSMEAWLCKLKGVDGFPMKINVKIFGFVFNQGVETDKSFSTKYDKYPVVRNWKKDTEQSPWIVNYKGKEVSNLDFYDKSLDFTDCKVVKNKNVADAQFFPEDWSTYTHPENINFFQTKYWNGTEYKCYAQRQYLRIGGIIENYATGMIRKDRYFILVHEMGHCFFLDDFYEYEGKKDYVWESDCGTLDPNDSIMFRSKKITSLDYLMMRHVWKNQKVLQNSSLNKA
tara:strand:+ start:641 stop:1627 length:987 start_codon:yes stop_codon:yes gene_type:complete